jgi:hypothetical protein
MADAKRGPSAIGLDDAGAATIVFHTVVDGPLYWARESAGEWTVRTIASEVDGTLTPSIALDSDGLPHVAFMDVDGFLIHAVRTPPDGVDSDCDGED